MPKIVILSRPQEKYKFFSENARIYAYLAIFYFYSNGTTALFVQRDSLCYMQINANVMQIYSQSMFIKDISQ